MEAVLRSLLDARPPAADSLVAWREATRSLCAQDHPVDRALVAGACADRLGFAFAAGYGEALRALVPDLDGVAALCATEAGGNHPRAIQTTLTETGPGQFELTGHKKWATVGDTASSLFVVATTGLDAAGTPRLRLVRIAANAPGVTITPVAAPFVPEIPHAEIALDRVVVHAADVLPGDGYDDYLKPFRTVEDAHVHAALLGYLIGVTRRHDHPHELVERLLALAIATRGIALADPKSPITHLALAGTLALIARVVEDLEPTWAATPDDEWQRWQRDRVLLGVAGKARAARRERAWTRL